MNYLSILLSFLISCFLHLQALPENKLCNADFQNYNITNHYDYANQQYQIYMINDTDNDPCWFVLDNYVSFQFGYILLEKIVSIPNYTMTLNLCRNPKERICQNVSLQIGKMYNFSFQIAFFSPYQSVMIYSELNKIMIINETLHSINFPKLKTMMYVFTAKKTDNLICVGAYEPCVAETRNADNFYLAEVKLIPIFIWLQIETNSQTHKIALTSISTNLSLYHLQYLQNHTRVVVYGKMLNQFFIDTNSSDRIQINFYYHNALDLIGLKVQVDSDILEDYEWIVFKYVILFRQGRAFFFPQAESDKKAISELEMVGTGLFSTVMDIYTRAKLIGCSYLFMGLLTFINVSILYNFLNASAQPLFSYRLIMSLGSLYLGNDDAVFSLLSSFFDNIGIHISNSFPGLMSDAEYADPKVAQVKDSYFDWFGKFGISANFLENNFIEFFLLIFLVLKMVGMYILASLLPCQFLKPFTNKNKYYEVFVTEVIVSSPIMCISAMCNLLNSGSTQIMHKINFLLHILLMFALVILPFIYFFVSIPIQLPAILTQPVEKPKDKLRQRVRKIIMKNFLWERLFCSLQLVLNVLLPLLVSVNSQVGSLGILWLLYFFLLLAYYRGYSFLKKVKKISRGMFLFILGAHNIGFTFLCVVSQLSQRNVVVNQTVVFFCNIFGFLVIATIIGGGICETIDLILEATADYVYMAVQKLRKQCRKNLEELQKQLQEQDKRRKRIKNYNKNKKDMQIPETLNNQLSPKYFLKQNSKLNTSKKPDKKLNKFAIKVGARRQ